MHCLPAMLLRDRSGRSRYRSGCGSMNQRLPLVICGLALRHAEVGMGVYTRRLIEGLLRRPGGHNPEGAGAGEARPESLSWLPEQYIDRVKEPGVKLPGLVRDAWFFSASWELSESGIPGAIFHSPAPAWALACHEKNHRDAA